MTKNIDPRFHFKRCGKIVSGMWKFKHLNDGSDFMRLLNFGSAWKTAEPDRLLTVFIRFSSHRSADSALGFIYCMEGEGQKYHDEFFNRMSEELQEEFGDKFRGYDLSSPTWIIEE